MPAWDASKLGLRYQQIFGDRVALCCGNRPRSLPQMLGEAVARAPDQDALIDGELRLTWQALDALVSEVAAGLAVRGVAQGDRIAVLLGNRAEFVVILHAVARLGAVFVPIGAREQAAGISHILNHCGARLLIYDIELAGRLPPHSQLPDVQRLLAVPPRGIGAPLAELRVAAAAPVVTVAEEDPVAILYTSGTTGRPKGAVIAHVNLIHAVLIYEHTMELGPRERSIAVVPLSHLTGLSGLIGPMLRCAGALIIAPEFKPQEFLALAARERMTHTVLVPAMYNLCLARADFSGFDLSPWRIGGYGGAPMPAPVIERLRVALPSLRLMNLYGATETVVPMAIMPPQYALSHREAVGLTAPGGEVLVMDDAGRECARGELGELWLRNATVVRGYWNDAEATSANFVSGFWRSGDLGRMDADGFIYVVDRKKDMINRGGYKVFSAEVESVLAEHPAVLECAIVAKPCPVLGERVHAFVSLRSAGVSCEELAKFCESRLADYKRPESFTLQTDPLPRNPNGKLLKREMRAQLIAAATS